MEVKGTAVIAIRDYVKSEYSSEFQKWVETLPKDSKDILTGAIDSTKWYNVQAGAIDPTKKIGEFFCSGNLKKGAWDAGRFSAQKALTGIYKIFVKAASPSYIIQRASRVFSTYYRPCEINVVASGQKNVSVEMSKLTERHEVIENRIGGWMQKALELSGCENVKVAISEVRKDSAGIVVEFAMSWD
ncbi:MAG: hypothetical protein JXA77_17620 [Bacteroidales bacterium]|nr:hypothetical protein [Bacteroidales bacterium]MBN2817998.1 hypothetical protein [Bacteroidales bacterium]